MKRITVNARQTRNGKALGSKRRVFLRETTASELLIFTVTIIGLIKLILLSHKFYLSIMSFDSQFKILLNIY